MRGTRTNNSRNSYNNMGCSKRMDKGKSMDASNSRDNNGKIPAIAGMPATSWTRAR
jgi:hypothetical protein